MLLKDANELTKRVDPDQTGLHCLRQLSSPNILKFIVSIIRHIFTLTRQFSALR